ncbi:MAG TPA: SpoIIE family protein phosphatase, partial [Bacteroidales bacterium]
PNILHAQDSGETITDTESQAAKYEKEGNTLELARCQVKLGFLYREKNNLPKSIENFQKALKNNETLGNQNAVKTISSNLGILYAETENYEQSLVYLRKSLAINEKLGKRPDMMADMINIAQVLQNLKRYQESSSIVEKASAIAQELSEMVSLKNCYTILSENYEKSGNQAKAKEYFELASSIKNKLEKQELQKYESRTQQAEAEVSEKNIEIQSKESQIRKISREQQLTLELLKKQKELSEAREKEFQAREKLQEARHRNTYLIIQSLIVILVLVTLSLLFIFKQLREKKKAYNLLEKSNRQVIDQKEEIEKQHEIVTSQKKKITDSIYYAQRIQSAVLPPVSVLDRVLPENFVIYNPRDIVSGDFYWVAERDGIVMVAAADCTGHGVPGAFMSMLGIAFLNEIVSKASSTEEIKKIQANEVLNQLREHVIVSLHQSGKPDEPKDGMEMAMCIIDTVKMKMQYAGAHNPVFFIHAGKPVILEADKMSIGIYQDFDVPFTNQWFDLESGDIIYLYSDGFYDQFGGPRGGKLLSANFRKFLLEIHQKPMTEQRRLLEGFYKKWKGHNDQVDDVMVVGIKIKESKKTT